MSADINSPLATQLRSGRTGTGNRTMRKVATVFTDVSLSSGSVVSQQCLRLSRATSSFPDLHIDTLKMKARNFH
jgi:hypothetical protein